MWFTPRREGDCEDAWRSGTRLLTGPRWVRFPPSQQHIRRGCWKTAGLRTRRAWFDSTGGRCFMGIWRRWCARLSEQQEDPVRFRGSPLGLWDHRPMGGHRPRASVMGVRIPLVPLRLSACGCGVTAALRGPIPTARVRPPPPALSSPWLRRSTARTADCRSVNTGSIPVGVAHVRHVVQQSRHPADARGIGGANPSVPIPVS